MKLRETSSSIYSQAEFLSMKVEAPQISGTAIAVLARRVRETILAWQAVLPLLHAQVVANNEQWTRMLDADPELQQLLALQTLGQGDRPKIG